MMDLLAVLVIVGLSLYYIINTIKKQVSTGGENPNCDKCESG